MVTMRAPSATSHGMNELTPTSRAESRSLRVYMDACVHCGACSDKCHYFLGTGDPSSSASILPAAK